MNRDQKLALAVFSVSALVSAGIAILVALNKDEIHERITEIKKEMQRIIDHDYEIMRTETPTEEAIKLFNRQGLKDKELLLSTRGKMFINRLFCGDSLEEGPRFLARIRDTAFNELDVELRKRTRRETPGP